MSQIAHRPLDPDRLNDHRERLYRAAYTLCGTREEAEDLVQETYVRILRRPRFIQRDTDLGYLMKALRNTWASDYRTRAPRPQLVEFDESVDWVVDPAADPGNATLEIQAIYAAVRHLSPPLRDTLVAVDIVGLSYKQTAALLGTRIGTIMSRLHRARERVIEELEGGDHRARGPDETKDTPTGRTIPSQHPRPPAIARPPAQRISPNLPPQSMKQMSN
jgi:RNA polymerase sigma-70 factor (ECF subfamily)